mmetsp:Transcript_15837/g.32453  ORF Transcript_15837/g.32453 Transcript_15837/m.32453 type:complete len:101 (-) Transcript_15837:165-467(-)
MRYYDITMHVECFLSEDKTNPRGYYYNTNQEKMIPRQLFSYIMFKSERKGRSIQAWIGFALQTSLAKSTEEIKTTSTTSRRRFFDANPGLRFTLRCRNRS